MCRILTWWLWWIFLVVFVFLCQFVVVVVLVRVRPNSTKFTPVNFVFVVVDLLDQWLGCCTGGCTGCCASCCTGWMLLCGRWSGKRELLFVWCGKAGNKIGHGRHRWDIILPRCTFTHAGHTEHRMIGGEMSSGGARLTCTQSRSKAADESQNISKPAKLYVTRSLGWESRMGMCLMQSEWECRNPTNHITVCAKFQHANQSRQFTHVQQRAWIQGDERTDIVQYAHTSRNTRT
mgnify:CR=1 FL=1